MFINFPKYNTKDLQSLVSRAESRDGYRIIDDDHQLRKLENDLIIALEPLFEDELAFYE